RDILPELLANGCHPLQVLMQARSHFHLELAEARLPSLTRNGCCFRRCHARNRELRNHCRANGTTQQRRYRNAMRFAKGVPACHLDSCFGKRECSQCPVHLAPHSARGKFFAKECRPQNVNRGLSGLKSLSAPKVSSTNFADTFDSLRLD